MHALFHEYPVTHSNADVAVIGAGIAGLCSALAVADAGLDVMLCTDVRAGDASTAAGGMLDTGRGVASGPHQPVFRHARDLWPGFTAELAERTGIKVPLNRDGIIELASDLGDANHLRARAETGIEWLDVSALGKLEPHLAHHYGALHHRHDGAVNPLALLTALKHAVGRHVHVRVVQQTVAGIKPGPNIEDPVSLTLGDGSTRSAMRVVVACGAWAPALTGVPRLLPVAPLRGQLMSVASKMLRHVVVLGDAYAIPRGDGRTILGSVDDDAGLDASHSEDGVRRIRELASGIAPALGSAPMLNTWAGLRPMTPDGLPIIGPDERHPAVIYACGHGRNGILLGPMTGALVVAAVTQSAGNPLHELFSPSRFIDRAH